MTRKMRGSGGGGGPAKWQIAMDYSKAATREPYRCRVSGFKSPFFGITEEAVCLQVAQAIKSQREHRAAARTTISSTTTTAAGTRKTRKTAGRTRQRTGRQQLAEAL